MKFLVLALFLSQTTAVHHRHQAHSHHRHQAHHQGNRHGLLTFDHKPNFNQFLALDSAERAHHKMEVQAKEQSDQQGILDKVQKKFENEEKEKEQIKIAKEAQEMQDKAIQEAELISKHKAMREQYQQKESLSQATALIELIKKGNVNAEQLSQILTGQIDLSSVEDSSQSVAPASEPSVAPLSMPAITQEAIVPEQPAPQPVTTIVPTPESPKKVEVVHLATVSAPVVQQKAPEKPPQQNVMPASLPQVSEARADELEDSISSIAQRAIDEKQKKEGKKGGNYMKDLLNEEPKKMTLSERAENKFIRDDPQASKEVLQDEALDNPISEYFANKHPDVVKTAQERHYISDKV